MIMQAAAVDNPPGSGAWQREDVCRMLGITPRQLAAWEKLGFLSPGETFGFPDLVTLKTLRRLRELHIPVRKIKDAVSSLKMRLEDIDRPLAQLRITTEGRRIAVHVSGSRMEALSGQLLFDFGEKEIEKLRAFPMKAEPAESAESAAKANKPVIDEEKAEFWFQRGLALEETGAPIEKAIDAYRKALEANPAAPGALVNMGTILFRQNKLRKAQEHYVRAVEADPAYPLAHFNLGNLADEMGDAEGARKHYLEAVRLNPRYADAYFNLALLAERTGDILRAIGYWSTYLKLDTTSSWARAARKQLDKLKKSVRSK
jgi:tetratricopeptide (TPR) repeat protein